MRANSQWLNNNMEVLAMKDVKKELDVDSGEKRVEDTNLIVSNKNVLNAFETQEFSINCDEASNGFTMKDTIN